jgi:hypothetical protein
VAEAAGQAVSAHEVRVMLDVDHGPLPTGIWIADGAAPLAVDIDALVMVTISDPAGRLGEMSVRLRPGRTVRPHELRLLTDIAEQAAVAFRNAGLQAELAARVALLDESTAQIAASRLRLIEAGDAERRRLEGAISREVTPLLSSLAADLGPAPRGGRPATDTLVDRATAALDALRELTRGIFPVRLRRPARPVRGPGRRRLGGRTAVPGTHRGGRVLLLHAGRGRQRRARVTGRGRRAPADRGHPGIGRRDGPRGRGGPGRGPGWHPRAGR